MEFSVTGKKIDSHHYVQIYPTFAKAQFVRRSNRFVMELTLDGKLIQAYVPNTGRMSEFLVEGHPFYFVKSSNGKYPNKVISTQYQGNFVFLDTVKVNDVFHELLRRNLLNSIFPEVQSIRREYSILNSRFDFRLQTGPNTSSLVEIKSCTLVHNNVAMFPDAPTLRGQKHIRELQQLSTDQRTCHAIYLIMNGSADSFFPNFHTDYDYGLEFLKTTNVKFIALGLNLIDPVTIDLSSIREIPINRSILRKQCVNKGNYMLLLNNETEFDEAVGKLGKIHFSEGYYVYVGSALNSLDGRIKRHHSKQKKLHWHIDYIVPQKMRIKKVFPIRRTDSIESGLVNRLTLISDKYISNYGSSDSNDPSHLFYFKENPIHNRNFLDIIPDAQTFTI